MRKKIERSDIEMIEFFENIGWDIGTSEKALIKSSDYICKYRNKHGGLGGAFTQKIEKVINFFYEPDPETMPFGIFWDDGLINNTRIGYMGICADGVDFKYNQYFKGEKLINWNNFKEIKTIEELKEFCK